MEQDIANNIYELSSSFALRIVKLYKYLIEEKKEYVMSKQLLRSGTSEQIVLKGRMPTAAMTSPTR